LEISVGVPDCFDFHDRIIAGPVAFDDEIGQQTQLDLLK
jgi:hypothetical protein